MKSRKYVRLTISIVVVFLLIIVVFNVVIDPLYQYHTPWFGLKPVITNERYQNAGIAKNFEYENVLLGNSMCENFLVSDISETFGGKTVKLTASGSFCLEWSYVLGLLKEKADLNTIVFNFDINCLERPYNEFRYKMPLYLYDDNIMNDVNFLLNLEIIKDFSIKCIYANILNRIPDYDRAFFWADDFVFDKEILLDGYVRKEISIQDPNIENYKENAQRNIELLTPYFEAMPNTEFVIFCSPFSMLSWDEQVRGNTALMQKEGFLKAFEIMTCYNNVKVFFWTDDEMLDIMSNLDNYKDSTHYSPEINKEILRRIKAGQGLLTRKNYIEEVDKFFDFVFSFDYDSLFE